MKPLHGVIDTAIMEIRAMQSLALRAHIVENHQHHKLIEELAPTGRHSSWAGDR